MQAPPDKEEEERQQTVRKIGVFITIPFILAASPLIGWLIGNWLDKKLGTQPYLMYLFVILGFAAGFRELYRIVKQFGNGT